MLWKFEAETGLGDNDRGKNLFLSTLLILLTAIDHVLAGDRSKKANIGYVKGVKWFTKMGGQPCRRKNYCRREVYNEPIG